MRLSARFLTLLIRFYQLWISPIYAPQCRYYPTCSRYALQAVQRHGAGHGAWLATKRICRCHPWGGYGYDPVPLKRWRHVVLYKINASEGLPPVPFQVHYTHSKNWGK